MRYSIFLPEEKGRYKLGERDEPVARSAYVRN